MNSTTLRICGGQANVFGSTLVCMYNLIKKVYEKNSGAHEVLWPIDDLE